MRVGNYQIDPVFGNLTPQLRGELVQFWLDEKALPDANRAWARTNEAVCIARDPAGTIASVNTVYLARLQGGQGLHYFYRMFTRPRDRSLELVVGMVRVCRTFLESSPLRDPRACGFVVIAENPKLRTPAGRRLLSGKDWTLVGQTNRGFDVWRKPFAGEAASPDPT